jgi:hypothetical protein
VKTSTRYIGVGSGEGNIWRGIQHTPLDRTTSIVQIDIRGLVCGSEYSVLNSHKPQLSPKQSINMPSTTNTNTTSALCSLSEFLNQEYDYLIIGGGTAGLCVAARLTENPDVIVGVLEAGANRMDDPQVYTPSLYPTLIGREKYDWCYESVPQPGAGGKTMSQPRGKVLGGSSAINYLMYVRGSKEDYDAW